ncbi:hypothetical protein [Legionella genomosp. 1]|uniref:hypothetical protein n=1 Tax=Legionella genomosp. 1 TaxID=1093625 RepID=UPI0010556681|nr:hypothetical protein [Legionella genomosp. 1]
MENELKNWIEDRVKYRNSIPLNSNNFLATSSFGQHDENNLLFDFSITLKRNNAIIDGEWEVIEDVISFRNPSIFIKLMSKYSSTIILES